MRPLLLGVFAIVVVFVGPDPADPEGFLLRFPDVRSAHVVENDLYLVVIALWLVHLLALHRTASRHRPTPALFGTTLAALGLALLAAGALPHIWQTPIAESYHAAGTTSADQASLVVLWQAIQGVFSSLLVAGLLLAPLGYIVLGFAMRKVPEFGQRVGVVSIVLGIVGMAAAVVALVEVSMIAALGVVALLLFHLIVGGTTARRRT